MDDKNLSREPSEVHSVWEDTELKWSTWETPVVIMSMVVGSDILRWLLGRYTSVSTISGHVLSVTFVAVLAVLFTRPRRKAKGR